MRARKLRGLVGLTLLVVAHTAPAQEVGNISGGPEVPGGEGSLLGPPLGALSGGQGAAGDLDKPLSAGTGPGAPRVPTTITQPDRRGVGVPEQEQITAPAIVQPGEIPLYGPLSIPTQPEEEGPPDGLTLDQAIERLVRENLGLRARALELPQADADILTAGLRANPLFFADSQLIPYGNYSDARPGGQVQYDINISYPLDVTQKRRARTLVARRARRVLEAQYQDAVRLQIDNLYTSFVDVLAARETIRFARAAREGLAILLERTRGLYERGTRTLADVSRLEALLEAAEVELMDAEEAMRTARRTLGLLLNIPPSEAESLQLRGTLRDEVMLAMPPEELVRMALECRPDVVAFRLGIQRAEAELRLARANRMSDVYVLYQPYTFQDNAPFDRKSARSWALGVTVPLPLYNRNQGNIERARINITQSQVELEERVAQVVNEVLRADREYRLTGAAVDRMQQRLIPAATRARDDAYRLFIRGEEEAIVYLNAQREYNEAARQYRDLLVRHRRSMLGLNTAVGRRVLP